MKCSACHEEMIEKTGELDLRVAGKLYLVRGIAYEECPSCGEKVLTPEVSQSIYDKIINGEFTEKAIRIPILEMRRA